MRQAHLRGVVKTHYKSITQTGLEWINQSPVLILYCIFPNKLTRVLNILQINTLHHFIAWYIFGQTGYNFKDNQNIHYKKQFCSFVKKVRWALIRRGVFLRIYRVTSYCYSLHALSSSHNSLTVVVLSW